MNIHNQALVLIADGKRYLLLRNVGEFRNPRLIFEGGGEKENPPTRDHGSDQPGRAFSSAGTARSAMEQTDFHQLEEDRFAAEVAEMLGKLAESGDFKELIVAAPAKCLAELRKGFRREVSSRIVAEIAKDLTKHPVGEITEILMREGEG